MHRVYDREIALVKTGVTRWRCEPRGAAQAAFLVLLAAATRAGIVSADLCQGVVSRGGAMV